MDTMKILQYAYDAAVTKWYKYDRLATQLNGMKAAPIAKHMAEETLADVKELADLIHAEEELHMKRVDAQRKQEHMQQERAKAEKEAKRKAMIAEAPYVVIIKWPYLGEIEYPCKSYKEAEKTFESAKYEVCGGPAIEAHVFEQSEGQRVPVMGIMRGDA